MNFDDRLATVLATDARGAHDRAVRWRQLVDLVARADPEANPHLIGQAITALRDGRDQIAVASRAAAARAIAGRTLPTALLALFAGDALEVAAPLLTSGKLDAEILDAASPEVRRFMRAMKSDVAESPVPQAPPPVPPQSAPAEPVAGVPTIGDFVARIERLRNERGTAPEVPPIADSAAPAAPEVVVPEQTEPNVQSSDAATPPPIPAPIIPSPARVSEIDEASPALFRWECGAGGEIGWVEGAPRGPLVGRSIARGERGDGVDAEVERAFARRTPFRDATLALPDAGAVGGQWLISGVPAFAPADGRFVGYRGIARRAEMLEPKAIVAAPKSPLDPAALRELVHEIKTPLNAIIGFAEIIDGQYLGPAQTGYRTRAAEIVAQAHLLLAAIDDLDFAARLRGQGGRREGEMGEGVALEEYFAALAAAIQLHAEQRGARVVIEHSLESNRLLLDRELVERLVERFAEAVFASAARDETLRLDVRGDGDAAVFSLTRPVGLKNTDDSALTNGNRAAMALRLVAGLAQIVGGSLVREEARLLLRLPLTAPVGPEGFEPPT